MVRLEGEEKPGGVFDQARKGDLDFRGEKLSGRKAQLTTKYKERGLPEPELTIMEEVEV